MKLNGVSSLQSAVLAVANLCIEGFDFVCAEFSGIFVPGFIPMSVAIARRDREFTAFVLRIFMKMDIAQVHFLISRRSCKKPLIRTLLVAQITRRLWPKTLALGILFQRRILR